MTSSISIPGDLEPIVGEVIAGRYRVERCLGLGGMAVVFLGRHVALDRSVAIKVLRPEYQHLSDVVARFDREARTASNLEHPNCIQVFDCGTTVTGFKFMVMPFLDGTELAKTLSIPMAPSQAASLAAQIAEGLEYVHRHRIIHRDLKPDNVFVVRNHDGRETLKIVDFGIAKLLSDSPRLDALRTRAGTIVGTPTYMSPEQAMGLEVDGRSDLYALGIILYQMLTAHVPFGGDDHREILTKHVRQQPPPLPNTIPRSVAELVMRLLEKNPDQRFDDAASLLSALRRVTSSLAGDATPWRPLLANPAQSDFVPSVPPLGGGTVASIEPVDEFENRPPSERSGATALTNADRRVVASESTGALAKMDLALAHILGSEDGIGLLEDIHGEAAGVRDDPSVVPVPLAADDDDDDDDAIDDRHSLIPSFEGFDD